MSRLALMHSPTDGRWVNARYFRVQFKLTDDRSDGPDETTIRFEDHDDELPVFRCPCRFELGENSPATRLRPVGRCIYCNAISFEPGTERTLSEEHIIPEGLGSRLILPQASCKSCADKIKEFEGTVLRTLLWAPRSALQIRRKKRKRIEECFPVTAIVAGRDVVMHLPLSYHPTMLFMAILNPPRIVVPDREDWQGVDGFWVHELGDFNATAQRDIKHFVSEAFDTVMFCQLLAKIAHGYAVAVLGLDGFNPLLPPFIRES